MWSSAPKTLLVLSLLIGCLLAPTAALAKPLGYHRGMALILDEYLRVYLALSRAGSGTMAAPTERRVKHAARRLRRLARRLLAANARDAKAGPLSPRRRWLLESIAKAGSTMSWARHLTRQRAAMALLSRAVATWAVRASPPLVNVVYFAKSQQVWLQRGKGLRSPYYGLDGGIEALSGVVVSGPDKTHATGVSHPGYDDGDFGPSNKSEATPTALPDYLRVE